MQYDIIECYGLFYVYSQRNLNNYNWLGDYLRSFAMMSVSIIALNWL